MARGTLSGSITKLAGQKATPAIFTKMLSTFRIDNTLVNEKIIGFLTSNKRRTKIVFKTKSMKPIGKKKERGQECPSKGEKYSSIISRINYLTGVLGKKIVKYKMKTVGSVRERDKIDDFIYNDAYSGFNNLIEWVKHTNAEEGEDLEEGETAYHEKPTRKYSPAQVSKATGIGRDLILKTYKSGILYPIEHTANDVPVFGDRAIANLKTLKDLMDIGTPYEDAVEVILNRSPLRG